MNRYFDDSDITFFRIVAVIGFITFSTVMFFL